MRHLCRHGRGGAHAGLLGHRSRPARRHAEPTPMYRGGTRIPSTVWRRSPRSSPWAPRWSPEGLRRTLQAAAPRPPPHLGEPGSGPAPFPSRCRRRHRREPRPSDGPTSTLATHGPRRHRLRRQGQRLDARLRRRSRTAPCRSSPTCSRRGSTWRGRRSRRSHPPRTSTRRSRSPTSTPRSRSTSGRTSRCSVAGCDAIARWSVHAGPGGDNGRRCTRCWSTALGMRGIARQLDRLHTRDGVAFPTPRTVRRAHARDAARDCATTTATRR